MTKKMSVIIIVKRLSHEPQARGSVKLVNGIMTKLLCIINEYNIDNKRISVCYNEDSEVTSKPRVISFFYKSQLRLALYWD